MSDRQNLAVDDLVSAWQAVSVHGSSDTLREKSAAQFFDAIRGTTLHKWHELSRAGAESISSAPVIPDDITPVSINSSLGEISEAILIEMLIAAVKLEFATIPPYLCALWSIKNDRDPTANSIREVLQEEMLHLALTCNLLAALGKTPKLTAWAPTFPNALPGGVHADLTIWLRQLDDVALDTFLRIESPVHLPPNVEFEAGDPKPPSGTTIGNLYESILAAFRRLQPKLDIDRQVTGPLSWRVIATTADVEAAIRLIQHQGEGALIEPLDSGDEDLAHYYRFLEIKKQKKLVYAPRQRRYVWQGSIKRPEVWPMGPTPKNGYATPQQNFSQWETVQSLLNRFDITYSKMLRLLDQTWQPGGQGCLIKAIDLMFELEKYAKPLMQIELPDGTQNTYGPLFRYRDANWTP